MRIQMLRIDPPGWAPDYAQHVVEVDGLPGERARSLAAPWLAEIFVELDRRVNDFANDPLQCFTRELDGFPVRDRLAGTYYIGEERYAGEEGASGQSYRLSIFVRCLEKYWHPNQERFGYDYLGLEALVNLKTDGTGYEFDEGFNTSVI
jgi:hypothetical protein